MHALRTFTHQVAHEARAHAALLVVLGLALPLAVWSSAAMLDVDAVLLSGAALLVAATLLGSELLAIELRDSASKGAALLRRLPTGIGYAILAKTVLVLAALVGIELLTLCFLGIAPTLEELGLVFATFGIAMLTMALSSWLPRASLTLAAGLVLVLLVFLPTVLTWIGNPWAWPDTSSRRVMLAFFLPLSGAVVLSVSARQLRTLRPLWRSAMPGAGVLLVITVPFVYWQTQVTGTWDRVRITSSDFWIDSALVSRDGRVVWLNCRNRSHASGTYCLRVDLEDSKFREVATRNSILALPARTLVPREVVSTRTVAIRAFTKTGVSQSRMFVDAANGRRQLCPPTETRLSIRRHDFEIVAGQLRRKGRSDRVVFPFDIAIRDGGHGR